MNRAVETASVGWSAWIGFGVLMAAGVGLEVSAVRNADLGLAISALGFALLGAFSLVCPIPFNADIRAMFRIPVSVPPGAAVLGGAGALLNVVGTLMRWLG